MSEINDVIRAYDAAHPYWKQEKREREIKAAKEADPKGEIHHDADHA